MKNPPDKTSKMWEKIRRELRPAHLFSKENWMPAIISGGLVGLMTSILSISFAVLIFGKAVPEALPIGIGMALFSNAVLHLCSAFASSGEGVVSHVQSLPPLIQAAMLSALVAVLPASVSTENRVAVAVFALLFSAIFTGAVLLFFGWARWGRLVRLLPLPVISGFLAAVGFALVLGGISTMTDLKLTFASLPSFFHKKLIINFLPGFSLTFFLWKITARWKNAFVFPMVLGVAVLLFYAICFAFGLRMPDLAAKNLLLGTFQFDKLWASPFAYFHQIGALDWSVVFGQIGIIATIPLVCFIGGLLMVGAIEFSTGSELGPNFELKTMGASNLISGILGGGFVGYPSATFTVMQRSLGATTRLAGVLSAAVPGLVLLAGADFLGFVPRFLVGGLLIFFGYQFIDQWVFKQFKHSTWSDLCIVGAIVATSVWAGFVASVGVGILVAVVFFLVKYSQTSVIRYVSTGASLRSRVTRNPLHDDLLAGKADRISIFGLQGYIFFGTAHHLLEKIMSRVDDPDRVPLDALVLDFRHATGIDTSVVQSFYKLYLQLRQKNIVLIFAQMPPKYRGLMQKTGFLKNSAEGFAEFSSLDEALEWRENHLLANSDLPKYQSRPLLDVFAGYFKDSSKAEILLQHLERLELQVGTKIIQQNTAADDLFFIESGRVSTYSERAGGSPVRLQTMIDDTLVGEIGFYLGLLRTATVVADQPSVVYRLTKNALGDLEKTHPRVAMELHRLIVEKTAKRIDHVYKSVQDLM